MGTPAFAADILASLLGWPEFSVQAVFTRPDREAGRGRRLMPSPVKVLALEKGLPVHQPSSMKTEEALQLVQSYEPDFLVVAAYGMILPQAVLDAARLARLTCIHPFCRPTAAQRPCSGPLWTDVRPSASASCA